jgi:hypothetical protein
VRIFGSSILGEKKTARVAGGGVLNLPLHSINFGSRSPHLDLAQQIVSYKRRKESHRKQKRAALTILLLDIQLYFAEIHIRLFPGYLQIVTACKLKKSPPRTPDINGTQHRLQGPHFHRPLKHPIHTSSQ